MAEMTCPLWVGYLLLTPIRRLFQDPVGLLAPHVREGMTVIEPGPAMGFFTLELARLVGEAGRVVAVDIQPKMLEVLKRRAARAGLADRIEVRLARPESMGLEDLAGAADFVLAFAMVHEMPDASRFFTETAAALKPGGTMLLAEPSGHVDDARFAGELAAATAAGLSLVERPRVRMSVAALLRK